MLVYTRPGCLFCSQVVELLQAEQVPFKVCEVESREEQQRIAIEFGAQSFPFVVVDGAYLGGYAHVLRLAGEGRLRRLGSPTQEASVPRDTASWSSKMDALRSLSSKR